MRRAFLASLLLAAGVPVRAQTALHEFRPELIMTSPRAWGVGVQLLIEQHLATETFAVNERIQGLGLLSPGPLGTRLALEARQVSQPAITEHRYIPTVFSTIPLNGGFELRNRTRVEIRDIDRQWSRRWQDRTAVGRDVDILGQPVFTYGQIDLSYDSRYSTLNRIDKSVGVRVPLVPGTSIDTFFTRQDDTRRMTRVLYATGALLRVAL